MQRIGQIERGETNCTLETIEAICRGLACEPIELFLFSSTKAGGGLSLPDARLNDLWKAADPEKKEKLLRILTELVS